jgi:Zn-dependent protease
MKNAWKLFEYKKTPVYLKYWFFAILLIIPVSWVVSIFIGIIIHELAHVRSASKLGYKTDYVFIDIFHGGALIDSDYVKNNKHAINIAFAGPLSNLLISLISFLSAIILVNIDIVDIDSKMITFLNEFTLINFLLFAFNLLPIYPLDGGRISKSIFSIIFGNERGRRINGVLSLSLSVLTLIYSLVKVDLVLTIFSIIFIIVSVSELKTEDYGK